MKQRKILSTILSCAMFIGSTGVVFAEDSLVDKISASESGAEIATLLESDTNGELGLDLTDYNKLRYKEYVGEMIYNSTHSTKEEIESAFSAAMEKAVTEKSIDTFSIGAVLNTLGEKSSANDVEGLQFKSGLIRNGYTDGVTGYVIYNEIENPSMIMDITADVTGNNAGSSFSNGSLNDREIVISGFSIDGIPASITNTGASTTYSSSTSEYSAFVNWVDAFTMLETPVKIGFELGSKVTQNIDLSAILPYISDIGNDTTSLTFKLSDAKQNNSLNGMKLNILYDNTIKMHNEDMFAENTFNKVYDVKNNPEQLKNVLESLSAEELALLEIDLTEYNALSYPIYAVKELVNIGYENAEEFKLAFDTSVNSMFESVEISNYDMGANLIEDATGYSDVGAYPGLEIRTTQVFNGFKGEGFGGYVWYNSIEKPSSIVKMSAVVTGNNSGTANNNRLSWINGYSTVLPEYRENKTSGNSSSTANHVDYQQASTEYNSWVNYSKTLTSYVPESFTFAEGTNISNEVDLTGIADELSKITKESTPLVIRFQKPADKSGANQRINGLKLKITYDNTVSLYNEEQLVLNSFNKIYDVKNNAEALDGVLSTLTSDEAEIVGIDMTIYNKLANSLYAAEMLSSAEWETSEEFAEVFDSVISQLTEVKTLSFDVGAVVNTNVNNSSDKYGLQFKSGLIRNGNTQGVTGYTMYYSVEDPYAVMDMSANITGFNTPTESNSRDVHVTGYSTSRLTSFVDESDIITDSPNYYYEPDTDIYNSFNEYAESFVGLNESDEIIVRFAVTDVNAENKAYKEGVDFGIIGKAIKNINKANTPLALKFSGASYGNSLTAVDLVITYDLTAVSRFDEGVLADINSIIDSTADAEVLAIGNEYAIKLLGDSYSLYAELANSMRVKFIRELAAAQCETIEAMSEKAVEIIATYTDVDIKYTIEGMDLEKGFITIKKNTNNTANYELVVAGYSADVMDKITLINSGNLSVDPNGVYNNYRDIKFGADGETFNLYIGDADLSASECVKVIIVNNLNDIKPMAKVFVK